MGSIRPLGQIVSNMSIIEPVGLFDSGDASSIGLGNVGATSYCGDGLVF